MQSKLFIYFNTINEERTILNPSNSCRSQDLSLFDKQLSSRWISAFVSTLDLTKKKKVARLTS
ncbi:Uncharacterized protein APZ42_004655 [Daphnia magna]|uniref:Uncharacterized protein n=1 Tax=Daphnia magna TaxID=35525 RepID=A0A0P4YAS1_9CRUS|nr:Uncharacterized protein APZ42_004655 [Daphnia magna]